MADLNRGTQDPNSPDDSGINARLFGGLNTAANPLSLPFEDSPCLKNCTIDLSGSIKKRKGTQVVGEYATALNGGAVATIATPAGFSYIVLKDSTSLKIYEIVNNSLIYLMGKSGVWHSAAANIRCDWTVTNEYEPRIIFVSGVTAPVQLRFTEQQMTQSGSTTTAVFTDANRFAYGSTSSVLIYVNNTRATGWAFGYSGTTMTITGLPAMDVGDVVTAVYITWQWQAEALRYKGYQLWRSVSRFNTVKSDQSVIVPTTLNDNIDVYNSATPGTYPMRAMETSMWTSSYTYSFASPVGEPSAVNEYGFGDGARYTYASGKKLTASPNCVVFGDTSSTTSSITEVYISRWRKLTFNGGSIGAAGDDLRVYLNGQIKIQSTTTAAATGSYGNYYLRNASGNVITSGSASGLYIDFTASTQLGIQATDIVEIINVKANRLGGSATQSVSKYQDGYAVPMYGLGDYSDYNQHSHPKAVGNYQGRLVYANWAANPMLVVASNLYDSTTPGVNFNNFQIIEETVTPTSAVDALLTNTVDDFIVSVIEYQGSLFAFTRKSVFRLYVTDGPLQAANLIIAAISNFGLINPRCVAKVDNTYVYLSDSGVFNLTATQESGGYISNEVSLKIRNLFSAIPTGQEYCPWVRYDPFNRELYVALLGTSPRTASRLYVFSTNREAWTEYTTPGGFQTFEAFNYTDRSVGRYFYILCSTYLNSGTPTNAVFLRTNYEKYIDYALLTTSATSATTTYKFHADKVITTVTSIDGVQEYPLGFELMPISNIEDIVVKLGYTRLTRGVDWDKRPNANVIYLYTNPGAGQTLTFRLRRPVADSLIGTTRYGTANQDLHQYFVYVDNVPKLEGTDWTIATAGGNQVATLAAPLNSVVTTGQCYVAYFATPLFTRQTLANAKRVLHWYGYFDNASINNTYFTSDVNLTSGQANTDLVGMPKVVMDGNIAFVYNADLDGEISTDLYGFTDIVWDVALFDVDPANAQFQKYALLKEPIQGIGYGFYVALWSFAETAFNLVGYQVITNKKGQKQIPWFG